MHYMLYYLTTHLEYIVIFNMIQDVQRHATSSLDDLHSPLNTPTPPPPAASLSDIEEILRDDAHQVLLIVLL